MFGVMARVSSRYSRFAFDRAVRFAVYTNRHHVNTEEYIKAISADRESFQFDVYV